MNRSAASPAVLVVFVSLAKFSQAFLHDAAARSRQVQRSQLRHEGGGNQTQKEISGTVGNVEDQIKPSRTVMGRTRDTYVCATLDWWPPSKCDYGICPWGQRGLLNLDLSSPNLRAGVKALAPLMIRMGGSLTDTITFDPDGTGEGCGSFVNTDRTVLGFELHGPCLTGKRWIALLDFCAELDCQVVLDVNGLRGRKMQDCPHDCWRNRHVPCCQTAFGMWDSSNARKLFEFTRNWELSRKQSSPVFGFEFGNELLGHGIQAHILADVYAADLNLFASIIRQVWPEEKTRPRIMGPGATFEWDAFARFLSLTKGNLDIVTHHFYSLGAGVDPQAFTRALSPSSMDNVGRTAAAVAQVVQANAPGVEIWVGETGGAYNSGRHLTTDVFASGFWYNDAMAASAQHGARGFCRQTLTGGMYGLLDTPTLDPNPDFYSALLWRTLMGPEVLAIGGANGNLRRYAHCSAASWGGAGTGGVTFLFLNLDHHRDAAVGTLDAAIGGPTRKLVYILTAPRSVMQSKSSMLNGALLQGFPNITKGREVGPLEHIQLPPLSQAFVVVPEADWLACKKEGHNSLMEFVPSLWSAAKRTTVVGLTLALVLSMLPYGYGP